MMMIFGRFCAEIAASGTASARTMEHRIMNLVFTITSLNRRERPSKTQNGSRLTSPPAEKGRLRQARLGHEPVHATQLHQTNRRRRRDTWVRRWLPVPPWRDNRSEEHTSELQSHSFISYAVFCL